jgi:HNH endonuclease
VSGNLILERWIFLAMTLKETTVNQILNAYSKIRQELQESGRITSKNFNSLKFIDRCISGKQETIQELLGNTFVDVYALLDMPEINSILTKEKLNDRRIKEQLREEKRIHKEQIREKEKIHNKASQEKRELKEYMRNYILQEERMRKSSSNKTQSLFAKGTASSILKSYNKFFRSYKEGDVISNVNVFRLRAISNRLNHKKEQVKKRYGNMFDEIYAFIERPEIASLILDETIVIKGGSINISNSEKPLNIEEETDDEELDKNYSQDNELSLLNTNISRTEILTQGNVDEYTDWLDQSTSEVMSTILKPLLEKNLEKESLESPENTLNTNTHTKSKDKSSALNSLIKNLEEIAIDRENIGSKLDFNPENLTDARERTNRAIVQRRGQPRFRSELLKAYGGQCAITDCDAESALEAAHIFPYRGTDTNHVKNGLLLRADIHTLFDLNLISIDPNTSKVIISSSLLNTCYKELNGKPLKSPKDYASPSPEAIASHYKNFLLKQNN